MSKVDNVYLFKLLSKNEKGSTDSIIFEKLLNEFENFILFKKLYEENESIMKIKGSKKAKKYIKFKVEFKTNKILKEFIKNNENKIMKYKHDEYIPIIDQIDKKKVEIYFEKIGG